LAKQGFTLLGSQAESYAARDSPAAVVGKCESALKARGLASARCTFIQRKGFRKAMPTALVGDVSALFDTALPGDTVIFSDRMTTHYTQIFSIERDANRMLLADIWPDKFFLRQFHNGVGAKATLVDYKYRRKLVALSRDDFNKAAIGLIAVRDGKG
jgi:hypothetical protein